jgi:hypothetical protein
MGVSVRRDRLLVGPASCRSLLVAANPAPGGDPASVPVVNICSAVTPALMHQRRQQTMSEIAPNPWVRTAVRCLASSRANERPISFLLDDTEIEVRSILGSWREPDYLCFRVETKDGRRYELRHHEYDDCWQLRE